MSIVVKVNIEDQSYEIDCDYGMQEVAWLAISASCRHGLNTFPETKYLPTLVTNKSNDYIHPKLIIFKNKKLIGDEINVKIRKKNNNNADIALSENERKWIKQAFGNEKDLMEVKVKFNPSSYIDSKLKKNSFFARFKYNCKNSLLNNISEYKYLFEKLALNFSDNNQYSLNPTSNIINTPNSNHSIYNYIDIELYYSEKASNYYESSLFVLPLGELILNNLYMKDLDGSKIDYTESNKNKIYVDRYPEPLLNKEKEVIIKEKESKILKKEKELQGIINRIEEEKLEEEEKLKNLQEFLDSVPYGLEEIHSYTVTHIHNAESDIEFIFNILYENDYKYFKMLYSMFEDYSKYFDNHTYFGEYVHVSALKHFFNCYFNNNDLKNIQYNKNAENNDDYEEDDIDINNNMQLNNTTSSYELLCNTFKYYYLEKKPGLSTININYNNFNDTKKLYLTNTEVFKFKDFVFAIIYTIYYTYINSLTYLPSYFEIIHHIYNQKVNSEVYICLYKKEITLSQFKANFLFLHNFFKSESYDPLLSKMKKESNNNNANLLPGYFEMGIDVFKSTLHSVCIKNKRLNYIELLHISKLKGSLNFYDFLEALCNMSMGLILETSDEDRVAELDAIDYADKEDADNLKEQIKQVNDLDDFEKIAILIENYKETFPDCVVDSNDVSKNEDNEYDKKSKNQSFKSSNNVKFVNNNHTKNESKNSFKFKINKYNN